MENDPNEKIEAPEDRRSPGFTILFLAFAPTVVALLLPEAFYVFLAANVVFSFATAYRLLSFTSLKKARLIFGSIAYGAVVFAVNYFLASAVIAIRIGPQ